MNKRVVLAFSGGLDTSFCVPWLRERGYDVYTLFADTGGVSDEEREYIGARAAELGAAEHRTVDLRSRMWDSVVLPLLGAGAWYQNQYPLLCSDRYLIVEECLAWCDSLGTRAFAHGCTAMGNDQVRFDLTVRCLGDYEIVAPVREVQREVKAVRPFEQAYLEERGFSVRAKAKRYTMNENLLGVTISGAEIDEWERPSDEARVWTAPPPWPGEPLAVTVGFEAGAPVTLDGERVQGPVMLERLNRTFSPYGVGRGSYTGDTTVGLKGRIVYEAPGLTVLFLARRALEEAVSTRHQNRFKPLVAAKWVELVYEGSFFDPLKADLEAYAASAGRCVTGEVTVETHGGAASAVSVRSPHVLKTGDATYAQSADWGVEEAEGFIRLFGQSSAVWASVNRPPRGRGE